MLLPGRDDCAPAARSQLTKISSIFFNNNVILLQQEESLPVVEAPDGNARWLEHDPEKRERFSLATIAKHLRGDHAQTKRSRSRTKPGCCRRRRRRGHAERYSRARRAGPHWRAWRSQAATRRRSSAAPPSVQHEDHARESDERAADCNRARKKADDVRGDS